MITLTADEAARALGGVAVAEVKGISTDSRTLRPGDLFVALRGERFDGHGFVAEAFAAGAAAALVEEGMPRLEGEHPMYVVGDTLVALGGLAREVRRKSGARVIAVTGSVGKTSTKDIIAAMAAEVGRVVSTVANRNNEVGVPLTLLDIEPDTDVAVVELGMRGSGQIAALADIVEPDVGVITNIHPVHLELLGSVEGIAEAKAELLQGIKPGGAAVVPVDSALLRPHVGSLECRVLRFGLGADWAEVAEVWGEFRRSEHERGGRLTVHAPGAEVEMRTPFVSRHLLENTVAAAAACHACGLPLNEVGAGVGDAPLSRGRGEVVEAPGLCVVNDTYNASPAAVRAAVDDLVDLAAERGGRAVAVLGDMLELGPEAEEFHLEAGAYAAEAGVEVLWGVGVLSRATVEGFRRVTGGGQEGHSVSARDAAGLMRALQPGDVVLFKASRSMHLEEMVERVLTEAAAGRWGSTP